VPASSPRTCPVRCRRIDCLEEALRPHLVQYGDVDSGRTLFDELLSAIRRASGDDDLEGISLELDLVFRLNDLRALPDDGIGRLEKIALSLDHHGSAVPPPLRLYADLVTGAAYTQHGDIQLAEAPMKRAYQLLNAGPADVSENPVYSVKQVAMFFYAQWADEAGQHDVSTPVGRKSIDCGKPLGRRERAQRRGDRPELDAIRSRIMGADLSGASERLARVKQQLGAVSPLSSTFTGTRAWKHCAGAAAGHRVGKNAGSQAPDRRTWHGATKNPFSDLLIYTLWPAGFDALQAIVNCGTGHAAEGLDRLTSLVNTHKDRLSSINPTLPICSSQGGLCAFAGRPAFACARNAGGARRAFASQLESVPSTKSRLLELERRLARNQLAER